jgi:hypothetical protein
MTSKIKRLIILLGIVWATLFSLLHFALFMIAYNSPTKSCEIAVNAYGEANIELILYSVTIIMIWCSSLLVIKHMYNGGKI